MADTVIERDSTSDRSDSSGWAVAVVVLLAVVVFGGLYFYYHRGVPAVPNTGTPGSANINVTLPSGGTGGNTSGGTTGGTSGGTTY